MDSMDAMDSWPSMDSMHSLDSRESVDHKDSMDSLRPTLGGQCSTNLTHHVAVSLLLPINPQIVQQRINRLDFVALRFGLYRQPSISGTTKISLIEANNVHFSLSQELSLIHI